MPVRALDQMTKPNNITFMPEKSPHENSLFRVIVFATALSFGFLGAIVGSMKGFFGGDVSFVFSLRTIAGFLLGCIAGWLLWKFVLHRMAKTEKPREP
jgi:hypothetical protein